MDDKKHKAILEAVLLLKENNFRVTPKGRYGRDGIFLIKYTDGKCNTKFAVRKTRKTLGDKKGLYPVDATIAEVDEKKLEWKLLTESIEENNKCPDCNGEGHIPENEHIDSDWNVCTKCRGSGRI